MNERGRTGVALVVCAPSGTGKTTLIRRLVEEFPHFAFSVSCTTRNPRANEEDGKDYFFMTVDEFKSRRDAGFFAEWAEVYGNFYGTPLNATQQLLAAGKDVLFDIDVHGASQIRQTIPDAKLIFILPPSREELERRLRSRNTETEDSLRRRLATAHSELSQAHWFHLWIINDDLEQAWQELCAAYIAFTLTPGCRTTYLDTLLRTW